MASWSNGGPKSFRLKWEWCKDAVENNLGGRNRGDWTMVRIACEFLCDRFPGQLALVVSNGFSGYNDDMGTVFYDGLSRGYKECPYDAWPWTEEIKGSNDAMCSSAARNILKPSQLQVGATSETHDMTRMLQFLMHQAFAAEEDQSGDSTVAQCPARRHNRRVNQKSWKSCIPEEAREKELLREQCAERLAAELIEEEVAEKKKKLNMTKGPKGNKDGRISDRQEKSLPGRSNQASTSDQRDSEAFSEPITGARKASAPPQRMKEVGRRDSNRGKEAGANSDSGDNYLAATDSGWALAKPRRRPGTESASTCGVRDREAVAQHLMKTWKTTPCADDGFHDWRLCCHYHAGGRDTRRNPFAVCYLPADALNKAEEVYHPINFRSRLCGRTAACPFREPYVCSFAHDKADLLGMTESDYLAHFGSPVERPSARLADYLEPEALEDGQSVPAPTLGWGPAAASAASARSPAKRFLQLTQFQDHLVSNSGGLWRRLTNVAELYLCRIERHQRSAGELPGLLVAGEQAEVDMVADGLLETLARPPEDLVSYDSHCFGARVAAKVGEVLARQGIRAFGFGPRDGVLVEADAAAGNVVVYALRNRRRPALGQEVLQQIRFWVQQQGLDSFVDCAACCDRINPDEGVQCPEGHYFCARESDGEGSCMAGLIGSQLASIRVQEGNLICPVCRAAFSEQVVAARVSAKSWGSVQRAVLDARVERRYAELQSEFDQRLQEKVRELVERFDRGDVSELVSQQGAAGAAEVRNSALNLACPTCSAVYAEFDGCMALTCSSCRKHFCGYCHKPFGCSKGCHEHVRECDMNLTANGSYYAGADIIKEAQRRFRVKRLKQFLRSGNFKKDVQNSVVFHLSGDLKDLGIDPAALFDVGNLQGLGGAGA